MWSCKIGNYLIKRQSERHIILKMKVKMKSKSHRYDTNRSRSRYGHKYSKYKKHQCYDNDNAYMY